MTTQNFQMLEHQLLHTQDETIDKLIEGTDQYYYYSFLRIFNKYGYNLTEKQQNDLDQYLKMNTEMSKKIALRSLFLKYDKLENCEQKDIESKQKEILQEINKQLFNYSFNIEAPRVKNQATDGGLIEQNELSSKFDEQVLDIESYLEQAYTESGFLKIKSPLYSSLDPKKLLNLPIQIIKIYLNNIGNEIIEIPDIPQLFCFLLNSKEFNNEFTQAHFRKLSLEQMEEIVHQSQKFLENQLFVGEMFLKKFQTKHTQLAQLQEIEKLDVLQQLRNAYSWTSNLPKFKSFNDQIHFELLQIGLELNEYDFDLFQAFLKSPKQEYNFASKKQILGTQCFVVKSKKKLIISLPRTTLIIFLKMCQYRVGIDLYFTDQLIEKYLQKYFEYLQKIQQDYKDQEQVMSDVFYKQQNIKATQKGLSFLCRIIQKKENTNKDKKILNGNIDRQIKFSSLQENDDTNQNILSFSPLFLQQLQLFQLQILDISFKY